MSSFQETYDDPIVYSGRRAQWSPIRSGIVRVINTFIHGT